MSLPDDINVIVLTGNYTDLNGIPLTGQVAVTLNVPLTDDTDHLILGAGTYVAPLLGGRFSITLPCTDNTVLSPTNFAYTITEQVPGVNRTGTYQLPHTLGATVDISALAPVNPSPPYSTIYALLGQSNTFTGPINDFTAGETKVADPVNSKDALNLEYFLAHGGAAVTSVNGQTGVVVLNAGNVGAIPAAAEGAPSGVATLDNTSHLTPAQLPTAAVTTSTAAAGDVTGTYSALVLGSTANVLAIIRANRLDQLAAPAAAVAWNSQKITGLANGTASSDAAAFGQIPTSLPPNGAASGDLNGTYPAPTVAKVNGIAVTGTPASGNVLTATSPSAATWQPPAAGGTLVTLRQQYFIGGPIVFNNDANWALYTAISLTIPAAVGDWVKLHIGGMWQPGSDFIDWAVVVSGLAVRYSSTDTSTPGIEGDPAFYPGAGFVKATGLFNFQVTSGDLDGGNVVFTVAHKGSGGTLYDSTNYPLRLEAESLHGVL